MGGVQGDPVSMTLLFLQTYVKDAVKRNIQKWPIMW